MKKEFVFEITRDILLNANALKGLHRFAQANRARKLRELGHLQTIEEKVRFNYFTVDVIVYPPTKRRLDPPNLYPTVKHLIDGMTDSELWPDDDWKHMKSMTFKYGGVSGTKKTFLIKFIIEEIKEDVNEE